MKILMIIDPGSRMQKDIGEKWKKYFERKKCSVRVFHSGKDHAEMLKRLMEEKGDVVIGFGLAGFEVTMYGGDLFFNRLTCPMIQFLTGDEDVAVLDQRLNINMIFYTTDAGQAEYVRSEMEFPPYIEYLENLDVDWESFAHNVEQALLYGYDRWEQTE